MDAIVPAKGGRLQRAATGIPEILVRAGPNAIFAAEEFFKATINNNHTKRAYGRAVKRFLVWCEHEGVELRDITPGLAGDYMGQLESGAVSSIDAIGREEHVNATYVSKLLSLAYLAPDLTEAILDGRQPTRLIVKHIRTNDIPLEWNAQRRLFARFH